MNNKQRFLYFNNFGILFAFKVFVKQLCINKHLIESQKGTDSLNELKLKRLDREFHIFVQNKASEWEKADHTSGLYRNCIWLFWYDGNMFAHPVLRTCYDSIVKHKPEGTEIILVTKENMCQYIDMPSYILQKVEQGLISLTHLSDIVRFKLLSRWGGTWFDATVFALKDFPMILQGDLWTIKRPNIDIASIVKGKWTSFAIGGRQNMLFYLMSEFWDEYWKRYDVLIDYFEMDLMMEYLYRNVSQVTKLLDSVQTNNINVQKFWPKMNEPYDEAKFMELVGDTALFKLTYRLKCETTTKEGNQTNYGYIEKITYN